MDAGTIRAIVREVLAEQREHDDALVKRSVADVLMLFAIDPDSPEEIKEARLAVAFARRWARSAQDIRGASIKAGAMIFFTGVVGLLWMGFETKIKILFGLVR